MYGPALAADAVNSGVDCWLKRVSYPIVDKWYREDQEGKSYHTDHGEGYDPYHVGGSRGCGGLAVLDGDELRPSSVYADWKVLANGPICTVFELTYDPWEVARQERPGGEADHHLPRAATRSLREHVHGRRPSAGARAGDRPHHARRRRDAVLGPGGWLAALLGDDRRQRAGHRGRARTQPELTRIEIRDSEAPDDGHILALLKTDASGRIKYCAGYAWERAGEITTREAWDQYLAEFSRRIGSPLLVAFDR